MSRLLTVEQVADLLAVRPALVRSLAHRGALSYCRVGGKLMRFREEDVAAYIAANLAPARRRRGVAEVLRVP